MCCQRLTMNRPNTMTKTILITGSTDGIGLEAAKLLIEQGHHVLVHGRNPKKLDALKAQLPADQTSYYQADLSDLEAVDALAKAVREDHANLDVLINNAGVFDPTPIESEQGFDRTWAVNVIAPFLLTRRLLPLVANSQDPCPRIITTSSISQSSSLPSPVD